MFAWTRPPEVQNMKQTYDNLYLEHWTWAFPVLINIIMSIFSGIHQPKINQSLNYFQDKSQGYQFILTIKNFSFQMSGKSWKIQPEFFRNFRFLENSSSILFLKFQFSGHELDRFLENSSINFSVNTLVFVKYQSMR